MARHSRKQPQFQYVYLGYIPIIRAMQARKMSQEELARAIKMTANALDKAISASGEFRPVRKFIGEKIAKGLDMPLAQLLRLDPPSPATESENSAPGAES